MKDTWDWNVNEPNILPVESTPILGDIVVNESDPNMVSIVIPIYNTNYPLWHYTGNCIGSIREHTDKIKTPYEIIVVDNASPIQPKTEADYKADKVIKNTENKGVAFAWNQGIRVSRGGYIVLLNNDTMVFDYWLEDLLKCLEHKDFVMATPMYGDSFARAIESEKLRNKYLNEPWTNSFSDFKDFACVACKKDLYNEIGLFDEQFTLGYGEDLDLMRRMDGAGKKYASTKLVNIFHIIGATSSNIPEIPDVMNKNKELLKEKWDIKSGGKSEVWGANLPDKEVVKPTFSSMPSVVRSVETGDKAFFVKDGYLYWITNPEVLKTLGYGLGDIISIDKDLFKQFKLGESITMINVSKYVKED